MTRTRAGGRIGSFPSAGARSLECSTADCRRRMPSTSSSFVVAFGHLSLLLLPPQVSRWVELDLRRQQRLSKNFFDEFRGSTNPTKLSDIKPCKSAKSWFWNSETNLVWKRIVVKELITRAVQRVAASEAANESIWELYENVKFFSSTFEIAMCKWHRIKND